MEFKVMTDLGSAIPAAIDFNFEELKAELGDKLTYYNALVVTPDNIKGGKDDRAKLNKLKTAIEDKRKEVKRQCLAPYEAFEARCKELTGMIDDAAGSIDGQVKAFEEAEKEEKRAALEAEYLEYIGELEGLLPFEQIFNAKWLNKGTLLAAAKAELQAVIGKVRNDVKVIRAMRCECEDQMLTAYFARMDMSAALMEKSRYETRQEQLAKLAEASATPPKIVTVPGHGEVSADEAEKAAAAMDAAFAQGEETKTIEVVFYDTTAAFRADMRALTEKHHIRYGGIQ